MMMADAPQAQEDGASMPAAAVAAKVRMRARAVRPGRMARPAPAVSTRGSITGWTQGTVAVQAVRDCRWTDDLASSSDEDVREGGRGSELGIGGPIFVPRSALFSEVSPPRVRWAFHPTFSRDFHSPWDAGSRCAL